MKEYLGNLNGDGFRFGIIASRFNELIVRSLLIGAVDGLKRHGVHEDQITVVWVPGAYEIPLIAKQMAYTEQYDALICVGAVIKGATPHFDFVAGQVSSGISSISLETDLPIIFSVLTTNTIEEALERAGTKAGNKGYDGAVAAIEMADLMHQIKNQPPHPLKTASSCCREFSMSKG